MKKILLLILIFGFIYPSFAYEFKSKPYRQKKTNTKKEWNFQKDKTLQRFELRHGDTAGFDKKHDGQRVELQTLWTNRTSAGKSYTRSKEIWTAALLKIPEDFPITEFNNKRTLNNYIFQLKSTTSLPLWDLNLDKGGTELNMKLLDSNQGCRAVNIEKNKWNEIVTYSNLATKNDPQINKYFRFWVNGKEVPCMSKFPIAERDKTKERVKKDGATISWGIYRPGISKWLLANNKNHPKNMKLNCPSEKWEVNTCRVGSPFKYEWENKVPTAVLYYDKVYVSSKRPKGLNVENLSDEPAYIVDDNQLTDNTKKGKFFAIVVRKSDPSVQFRAEDESKGKANVKAMRKCLEKFDDCSIKSSGTTK